MRAGITLDLVVSLSEGKEVPLARDHAEQRWSSLPVFPGSTEIIIVAVPDHSLRKVLEKYQMPARLLWSYIRQAAMGWIFFLRIFYGKGYFLSPSDIFWAVS